MAPTNPTVNQRVEELEEVVGNMDSKVADLVSKAVEKAVGAMKHSLVDLLLQGQSESAKKQGSEMEALVTRLEGRIARAREHQESMIYAMKNEQDNFQSELRSTLTGLQLHSVEKLDGSVNQGESSIRRIIQSPAKELDMGNMFMSSPVGQGYGGGTGQGGGPGNWRYRKLDMPLFDGTDPDGWILRVDRYFNFYKLSEEERLEAVVVALEGDALRWYQWEHKRHPIRRWADLKGFILRQFRSAAGGSLYEQWLATTQTTTVAEYRRKFIETAAPLERISEEILLGQFLNGLKEDIRAEVRLLSPLSLEQAMEMALRVEEKNKAIGLRRTVGGGFKSGIFPNQSKGSFPFAATSGGTHTGPASIKSWATGAGESQASVNMSKYTGSAASTKNLGEVRRLTDKELQEKRAKGLCFRCDDKWVIGHRCKRRELSVIVLEDEEDDSTEDASSEPPMSPGAENTTEVNIQSEVSLNSVIGISNPKTMKLRGLLMGSEVVVMIDPGATHNFVSLEKVAELDIAVTDCGGFGVSLGNGEAIKGSGICKDVLLQLEGGVVIQEDFLPLSLGSSDIILGVQWLEKLGTVATNWKSQVMQFEVGGNTVTLVGDPSLVRAKNFIKSNVTYPP